MSFMENQVLGYKIFRPGGRLFEEPQNLLKQEMRAPATYNAVITAIAQGASRLNEIATKAGLETGAASNVMSSLMELGIVRREIPATEKSSRKKAWRHFRFCRKT